MYLNIKITTNLFTISVSSEHLFVRIDSYEEGCYMYLLEIKLEGHLNTCYLCN
jgi:hypothetical protein